MIIDENKAPAKDAGIFGLQSAADNSQLQIIPVPWEATASYGRGTSQCRDFIERASHQLDLFIPGWGSFYERGIYLNPSDQTISRLNTETIKFVEQLRDCQYTDQTLLAKINENSQAVMERVYQKAQQLLKAGHKVAVLGGDHSSPYGLVKAIAEVNKEPFSILHIDAHFDLRVAYEGFAYSHASIMYNLRKDFPQVQNIVHLGIRDFCQSEWEMGTLENNGHFALPSKKFWQKIRNGDKLEDTYRQLLQRLTDHIYISFDIDGLDPLYCPQTGTPVPGGLHFQDIEILFDLIKNSRKKVIGFDLCEVGCSREQEWDANVAARILYLLSGLILS